MDWFYTRSFVIAPMLIASLALAQKWNPWIEWVVKRNGVEVFRIVSDASGKMACISWDDLQSNIVSKIWRHPINDSNFEITSQLAKAKSGDQSLPRVNINGDYFIVTWKNGEETGKWFTQGNTFSVKKIIDIKNACDTDK